MIQQGKNTKTWTYKCEKCKDTGWIEGEEGMKYCECTIRELAVSQWKSFGLNPATVKKIREYDVNNEAQKEAKDTAIRYVKNFEDIKKSRENSLALLGQSGAGKSHLIIAIGAALIEKGYRVVYMPYIEVISQLKANVLDEEAYIKILSKYQKADLLILDDLYKDKLKNGKLDKDKKLNEADIKHLYSVINYRYINRLPIVVSSEASPNILIDLDEAIAGRILESCGDNVVVFDEDYHNYRLRKWRV